MPVQLPISKSIANRLLVLQALNGMPLTDMSGRDVPEDVKLMHDALVAIGNGATRLDLQNCGTAMRFLTAYCAQREGQTVVLDGCERMRQRPIGQLVEALRACGAEIQYLGEEGFPPLKINGKRIEAGKCIIVLSQPVSTQFVSALMLMGLDVRTDCSSPYIYITREVLRRWAAGEHDFTERDWSAAAFWYEYAALHEGELFLEGLYQTDIQGDKIVADIFRNFGVETCFEENGVRIGRKKATGITRYQQSFKNCPDLYPAVAITCERLSIVLDASGIESLQLKESDRLLAVREHRTYGDHRIAMALLAADLPCDDIACIRKSYPTFYEQLCQLRR